jgi:hypothetical protein
MATPGDPQRAEEVRLIADRIADIARAARKLPPKAARQSL